MARVSEDEVIAILDGYSGTDASISPFLTAANKIVTEVFSGDTTTSDDLLEEIEKWLTAHLISATIHKTTSEEKVGDASATYTGQWGKKLESTPYGQMLLIIDVTGKMARAGKRSATMTAIKNFE